MKLLLKVKRKYTNSLFKSNTKCQQCEKMYSAIYGMRVDCLMPFIADTVIIKPNIIIW